MIQLPALIYCAGLGSRMMPLTKNLPKPLIRVGGKTLLDHALVQLYNNYISKRVVNVHYMGKEIRRHLRDRQVLISDETERLLDTGGGLKHALPILGSDTVVTINSDAVWCGENALKQLFEAWRPHYEALLLLVRLECAIGYAGKGDFELLNENLLSRGSSFVYTGLQIVKTQRFLEESALSFSTNVVWEKMLAANSVYGVVYSGQWCDVGRPENIPLAEELIESHAKSF